MQLKHNNRRIFRMKNLTPVQIIAIGFLIIILSGGVLLTLPISSKSGQYTSLIDCIFTSTSAVCVTGLVTLDTGTYWSVFGKTIIIVLIQIGGLGFMTFTTLLSLVMGKRITLRERLIMQEAVNADSLQGIVKLVKYIIGFTFTIEFIGAVLLSTQFIPKYGTLKGTGFSVFHSISAFCNAGFDLIGNFSSVTSFSNNSVVILTLSALIAIGGLGFLVWFEVYNYKRLRRLSLHSKIVIIVTSMLIIIGAVAFFGFEFNNSATMGNMGIKERILSSIFASISPRTAGFNSIDLATMTKASVLLTIILMFIGGSSGSTAGGIKTTTFGVLFLAIISVIRGREDVEVFQKRIVKDVVYKAITVTVIALVIVIGVSMVLSVTESGTGLPFEYYLFEATSAFGTVGLTLGLTTKLSTIGKILLSITMYTGRIGPLTLLLAIRINKKKKGISIRYPEDKILVG